MIFTYKDTKNIGDYQLFNLFSLSRTEVRTSHEWGNLKGLGSISSSLNILNILHSHPKNGGKLIASGDYKAYNSLPPDANINTRYFQGDLINLNDIYLYIRDHSKSGHSFYPKAYIYRHGKNGKKSYIFRYDTKKPSYGKNVVKNYVDIINFAR